jgi:hypothetical protein
VTTACNPATGSADASSCAETADDDPLVLFGGLISLSPLDAGFECESWGHVLCGQRGNRD